MDLTGMSQHRGRVMIGHDHSVPVCLWCRHRTMNLSYGSASGKKLCCWKIFTSFRLHVSGCASSLSDLSPVRPWSKEALSPGCMINPLVALLSGRTRTLRIKICKLNFSPFKTSSIERKQPAEQLNLCLQTSLSRYSWEGAKKTSVVKADELCNQIGQGKCSL